MSFKENAQFHRGRKTTKRVLTGEMREEEAARLEKEIAPPRDTSEPGRSNPSSSRPGWSSKPLIPLSERIVAEEFAKQIRRKR